jgi:site-specific DNA recombinase
MRAALYARISEDRDGTALGVTRQLEDCRTYAERRGWTVVDEYVDNDISASAGRRRPAYRKLLADIESRHVQAVVVWALDRLHRRPAELETFINLADQHKIALGSVGGDVDLATPAGRLHARIMGSVARHEVEQKGERIRRAALQRAERGGNHGGLRTYGYTGDGLHLVPAEADEVQHMFDALLSGVPLGALIRDLNARSVPTVRGGPWTASTVRDILVRGRNAGLSEYKGEVVGEGQWPKIVTEEVWRAAKALLRDPSRRTTTGNRASYLISGIATCGRCGCAITSAGIKYSDPGRGHRYIYRCRVNYCVGRRRDWVDDYITEAIIERLSRPDATKLLVDEQAPDFAALAVEAQALRVQLDEAAAAFADRVITVSQLRVATERLRARLDDVEAAQAHQGRAPVLSALVGADDVRAEWSGMGLDPRRAVVQTLMEIVLHPGGGGKRTFDSKYVEIKWKI